VQASAEEANDAVELADGRRFARLSQPVSLAGRRLGRIWRYREIAAGADAGAPAPAAETTRALRLKDEFIASLSHALRTPLGAVLGWSKALQLKRGDAATLARGLDAIARNAARQAELLDEMIDADRVLRTASSSIPGRLDGGGAGERRRRGGAAGGRCQGRVCSLRLERSADRSGRPRPVAPVSRACWPTPSGSRPRAAASRC
jgi:signal transduction histidine kinase